MYFQNCRMQMTWLDQCLKIPVLEHLSKFNMLRAPKAL